MKNKMVAAVLALLLGGIGVHRFYMGKIGSGILYLIFFWTSIPSIIAFIEFIIYLTCSDKEFNERYCGIKFSNNNADSNGNAVNQNNNNNIL